LSSLKGLQEPITVRVQRGFHRVGIGVVLFVMLMGFMAISVVAYEDDVWQHIWTIIGITLLSAAFGYAIVMFFSWIVIGFLTNE
jgi:hypothetical protein